MLLKSSSYLKIKEINDSTATSLANINSISEKQVEAIQLEGTKQTSSVSSEGNKQVSTVTSAGTTEVTKVKRASSTALSNIDSAKEYSISEITAKGTEQVKIIKDTSTSEISKVQAAGTSQVKSVSDEGKIQIDGVKSEGEKQVQLVSAKGTQSLQDIDTAKTSAVKSVNDQTKPIIDKVEQLKQNVNDKSDSVDETYEQMKKLHCIEISEEAPTNERTGLWVNPKSNEEINIPEVKDEEVSGIDTWSSQKINHEIDSLKEDLDNVNGTLLSSVFVESKNRYNKATSIIGTIGTQGVVREDASSAYLVSDYILLKSGKIYALSYYNTNYNKQYSFTPNRLVCFDLTKSFLYQTTSFQNMTENDYISYVSGTNENGEIYRAITPKQDLYVRFQTGKNFAQNMLQIGTDMIYENYFEDYYKVSLKKDIVAKENLTKELQEKIDSINSIQTEIDKIPVLENKVNPISESYDFNSIYSKIHRNVLFIGDSLTEGYQYKDKIYKDKSYPAFLSRMCDWNCTNKGQSGITTLGWWNAYGQEVDFTLYDAVFIYLGTNGGLTDTIDTDTASGDYNTFAKTNTGGYCAIVAKIRDVNPTCKIYIIKYADTAVSNITQKIADKYSCDVIVVLDTTHFTLNESKYHTDLTHYNTLGYYCFALNVLWQVEKIIKSKLDSYTAN